MKLIAGIILTLMFIVGIIGAGIWRIANLRTELNAANARVEMLEQEQALARDAEVRAMAARQVENEKARRREQLMENVLCDNPDWRDIVVPDDVGRMLQQGYAFESCLPASGDASR